MRLDSQELEEISRWCTTITDQHRDLTTKIVHIDNAEVWADGILVGHIIIDGDDYIFEPTSKGAST